MRATLRGWRRAAVGVLDHAVSTWNRSLQLRIAATTLLVSSVMVVIIGLFLVGKVSDGILDAKLHAALKQARIGYTTATPVLQGVDPNVPGDVAAASENLYSALTANGTSTGLFGIVVISPSASGAVASSGAPIPKSLRQVVQAGHLASQYAPVPAQPGSRHMVPGLVVGEPAGSGQFELYYLFPLTAEQETIALLHRNVALAGLALVLLVLVITVMVTRQVVRPVKVASRTAGQLAAGDLSKRIPTHGRDEIARLGEAFNDMAGSLQRQISRLEDLSRLQRRFTSDVSHELRTPLTTVRMAAEYLYASRDEFSPALARSAELLQEELDRFESLLADLLEISRHDAGAARLASEAADMRDVVMSVVSTSQSLARRHGSTVVLELPPQPVLAEMDTRRVERILRNLIGNALDHGEGRPITVTVGADADAVAVTVRDLGIGLRPGEAGLVFNRFWRGDPSRSRLTGGTGLGLAISLEDARLHDGWLQAWGERGRGAQFRLTLPRRAGHTVIHSPLPLDPDEADRSDALAAEMVPDLSGADGSGETPARTDRALR